MPTVTFHGGPCALTTRNFTAAQLADGVVTCKGAVYEVFDNHAGGYFAVLQSAVEKPPPTASAPQAAKAWRHVVQALVTTAPADLRKAQAARRHIARIGRRA